MGITALVDFDTFVREVLRPLPCGTSSRPLPSENIPRVQTALHKQSRLGVDSNLKTASATSEEDDAAETLVHTINSLGLPNGYEASLSRRVADASDGTKATAFATLHRVIHGPHVLEDRHIWTHCRLFIAFETSDAACDPWDEHPEKDSEAERSSRAEVRTQLIEHARNVFLHQHRTALLSLFVVGTEFRAVRWDRAGVVLSNKLDYVQDPAPLLQFVWHFAQLRDEQQGLDPTATLVEEGEAEFELMDRLAQPRRDDMDYMEPGTEHIVTESPLAAPAHSGTGSPSPSDGDTSPHTACAEIADADSATAPEYYCGWKKQPVFRYVRQQFRASLAPGWPRYKLEVGADKRVFLVAKPVFAASTMFGRATRGYVAVDIRTGRFVFLKDSWRPYYAGVEPEGAYLEQFAGDEDMQVPTVVCHGDVGGQVAFTARYEERTRDARKRRGVLAALRQNPTPSTSATPGSPVSGKKRARPDDEAEGASREVYATCEEDALRHHIHYRIAVEEVCLPLSEFRTTEQLIRLLYHCIETHYWAYERHKLLHRDVSAGNILILPRLVTDQSGVELVEWCGILTDWELATRVPECIEADLAERHPDRTGTWQFMSVDYVACDRRRPVVVADELESFLHVLLYYAVRFLPNTLHSVNSFVVEYFDTFILDPKSGQPRCSLAKHHAVRRGELQFLGEPVAFLKTTGEEGNPLNQLIAALLRLFAARYAVIEHESQLGKAQASRGSETAPRSTPTARPRRVDVRRGAHRPWFVGKPAEWSEEHHWADLPHPRAKEEAAKLDSHREFLRLFVRALDAPEEEWRDTEVTGRDQLVDPEPRSLCVAAVDSASGTGARNGVAKRPKTDACTAVGVSVQ
ncbi:hypothetical protein OH77DRAFT_146372 [Trametes cingulata]|nr:hypothetical protein OH77DRAFT_146372 [Trametes cingulata]